MDAVAGCGRHSAKSLKTSDDLVHTTYRAL